MAERQKHRLETKESFRSQMDDKEFNSKQASKQKSRLEETEKSSRKERNAKGIKETLMIVQLF